MIRCALICIILSGSTYLGNAQKYNRDLTDNFAFKVKTVDDFFERFNFQPGTEFLKYCQKKYPYHNLTRSLFIKNLFDSEYYNRIDGTTLNNFLYRVIDSPPPSYLNYSDKLWFAEVKCNFIYQNKPNTISIFLKVIQPDPECFAWYIVSAQGDLLQNKNTLKDSLLALSPDLNNFQSDYYSTAKFMSPMAHALDFFELNEVFSDKEYLFNYIFAKNPSFELKKLVFLIKSNKLKLQRITKIQYHLMQIDGWIMVLDNFPRMERNAGWLVSDLIKASNRQKKLYLKNQLNLIVE